MPPGFYLGDTFITNYEYADFWFKLFNMEEVRDRYDDDDGLSYDEDYKRTTEEFINSKFSKVLRAGPDGDWTATPSPPPIPSPPPHPPPYAPLPPAPPPHHLVPFPPPHPTGEVAPLCGCSVYRNGAYPGLESYCQKREGSENVCRPYTALECADDSPMCSYWGFDSSPPSSPTVGPGCNNAFSNQKCENKVTKDACKYNKKIAKNCIKQCYTQGYGVQRCEPWSAIEQIWTDQSYN